MKVNILNESKQSLGGGWSFIRNFEKGVKEAEDIELVENWQDSDVVLIPSASMVMRDTVGIIKSAGKPVVLRLDNIPRNSRNRGAGTSRLYDIAQMADKVIYQSKWARDYLMPFLEKYGMVIYNGVDTEIFNKDGAWIDFQNNDGKIYLYSRYNRDETKGWERAWYQYQMIHRADPKSKLIIVGQFSDEIRAYNFDFYNGENFEYRGVIDDPMEMANIIRGCDVLLAPYYNDAYSNTIQEALACGLEVQVDMSGGTPELLENGVITLEEMVENYREALDELV